MKSAKNGERFDASSPLNRARNRRILVQGSMRSDAVVIVGIGSQDSAQMRLAQDNEVVHTLTPDRSDQPFGKAILPRLPMGRDFHASSGESRPCANVPAFRVE
jgi:hypothetical protein